MIALAVLAGALAAWLWQPADPRRRWEGLQRVSPRRGLWEGPVRASAAVVCAAVGVLAVAAVLVPRLVIWAVVVEVLAGTAVWVWLRNRDSRRRRRAEQEVTHACQLLAGLLRVGQVPAIALASAASDCPALAESAATQGIGGDAGEALCRAGEAHGYQGLRDLGQVWRLCERTGAPVAQLALGVAEALRAQAASRAAVDSELAGARMTGWMLAALPLLGLGLGYAIGGNPLDFLVGTAVGRLCILGGVVLACAGVIWTERMADLGETP